MGPAHAACVKARVVLLPVTLWQDKLFVPVKLNNIPAEMFMDTGAGTTTLSQTLADSLRLPRSFDRTSDTIGVGGLESHLYIAQADSIALGSQSFAGLALPVAAFPRPMADGSPAGGLVGADILSRYDLEIDIPRRTLGLWRLSGCTDATPDWPSRGVPLDIAPSGHIAAPVTIDGVAVRLLLDTGSPGLVLSTRAAARAGAPPEALEEGRRLQGTGVNNRPFAAWLHVFPRLEVAGQVFGDARAVIVSNGRLQSGDGLLGLAFLKRGRVWVSYKTGWLFLEK